MHNGEIFFSATIADVDHYVLAFAYFLEFASGRFIERTTILPPGALAMPETVRASVVFEQRGVRVALMDAPRGTRILVSWPRFDGDQALEVDLLAEQPKTQETMNVVIPWSRDRFQFTSKQNCLPAHGSIAIGRERMRLERRDSFGCLDFGRGVWRYRTAWNWGACSTRLGDGRTLGLNLGGTWTDGTGMTENAICLDGRISKLGEALAFRYDGRDLMRPWRIRSRSRRVDLRFTPSYERVATARTGMLASDVHQMFGHYDGTVTDGAGERLPLVHALGWIEEHKARW
ncbi:MAG: DUF2804 domain-containing protein [Chloroflexi bacterium]|nr:DUF2804 domain-containing protein [Chloroflexota bacterium]